eukprot:NODE_1022_length_2067_cov_0.463923.p1 type:complete len:141 gc:universal NODE_1022_length_2067_cov_0.463923:568-990(+)
MHATHLESVLLLPAEIRFEAKSKLVGYPIMWARLKQFGKPAATLYTIYSTIDLSIMFAGIHASNISDKLQLRLKEYGYEIKHSSVLVTDFFVAYSFHKLLLPIRMGLTLGTVRPFIRECNKRGYFLDAAHLLKSKNMFKK